MFKNTLLLVISGFGNEAQIIAMLHRYMDRPTYMTKALYFLFKMTTNTGDNKVDNTIPRVDLIQVKFVAFALLLKKGRQNSISKRIKDSPPQKKKMRK